MTNLTKQQLEEALNKVKKLKIDLQSSSFNRWVHEHEDILEMIGLIEQVVADAKAMETELQIQQSYTIPHFNNQDECRYNQIEQTLNSLSTSYTELTEEEMYAEAFDYGDTLSDLK